MLKLLLTVTVILLSWVKTSLPDNVEIQLDTPNVGDTTTITTVTSGTPVTSGNLISQDWIDGSWVGDMFPDSSDINENQFLTGKHDKHAETTINSEDYVTLEEMQQGFTSNFNAQIRWWNPVESTVTMSQTASNGIDTTTQSTTFEDTTNHNYEFNNYGNTLTMNADPNMTHGTMTYRFDFNIIGNKNYNGGHSGVDVTNPTATIDYQTLSSTTITTVEYCWQKNPPTCPATEELEAVEETLQEFETIIQDFEIPEDVFIPEYIEIDYDWNNDFFEEDIVVEDDFEILALDDFFFEEDYFETDYYEEPQLEIFIPEDAIMMEEMEMFDELPSIEIFNEMPDIEEVYEAVPEEIFVEEFTEEMQEEFIDDVEEYFEEVVMEEPQPEATTEPMEEIAMVEEEVIQEEPVQEEVVQEEVVQEEVVQEEPTEEIANEIEEQPSSEEPVADEPESTTEVAEQEEAIEEPTEVAVVEGKPTEEPDTSEENVEVDLDIKVAAIEKAIQGKIKDVAQQIDATLTVVNELVSREMISQQPDMSSYFNANTALFDTRQLPSGNQDFFLQASLDSYSKPIYVAQANIAGTDPVVQYQIKVNNAKQKTNEAYKKLKELLNARNVQ